MDKIHLPEYTLASEVLDFEKYFKDFQSECRMQQYPQDNTSFVNRQKLLEDDFDVPLSMEDIYSLEKVCSISKLDIASENVNLPLSAIPKQGTLPEKHPVTPESLGLETVKNLQKLHEEKLEMDKDLKTRISKLTVNEECDEKDLKPGEAFVYTLTVYRPLSTVVNSRLRLSNGNIRPQYEILVLNSNTLVDLVNVIQCVSDDFLPQEVESMQEVAALEDPREKYPSKCFFIENVFYNDMSHPNASDYSEVVRKWGIEKNIGEFKSQSMENVKIGSLKFRLGYGYVYIHQGNCEHLISFSDARLLMNSDTLASELYPKLLFKQQITNFTCFICNYNHSNWLVVNSDRLPVRKAFFCDKCCESYMFLDGKKLGTFQLYPYHPGATAEKNDEGNKD